MRLIELTAVMTVDQEFLVQALGCHFFVCEQVSQTALHIL